VEFIKVIKGTLYCLGVQVKLRVLYVTISSEPNNSCNSGFSLNVK